MRMWSGLALGLCLVSVAARAQDPPKPPRIDVDLPLAEGVGEVTGSTTFSKVTLRVYSGWRGSEPPTRTENLEERLTRANRFGAIANEPTDRIAALACAIGEQPVLTAGPVTVADDETFRFELRRPLTGGECVVVSDAGSDFQRAFAVTSSIMDFGRLRGYFSVGSAVAQSRGNFSTSDTFVSLTTDARIVGKLLKSQEPGVGSALASVPTPLELRAFRYQLNGIVDARVGVKFQSSDGAQAAATGGQPAEAPFQRPDQLQYSWDQPGYLQLGLHLPVSFKGMDWRSDGKLYSFFVGPIVKGGVQAFSAPVVVSRTVEIDLAKAETDTSRYKTTLSDVRDGALPFMVYGTRIGIYGYELLGQTRRNRQMSNDPISYVDITWGRSAGYRSYTFARSRDEQRRVETVSIASEKLRRLAIEGRLKIPSVPALVGFDVNLRAPGADETPNDFRFLVAFRIDAQRALAQIVGTKVTSGR